MKLTKNVQGVFIHLLVASWIIGFTFVWILPDMFTNFIKPIVICGFAVDVLRKKRTLRIDFFPGWLILFGAYCMTVSLFFAENKWLATISFCVNILYAACICMTQYEKEEYCYMLRMLKVASLFMAVVVLVSNPLPMSPANLSMKLFHVAINRNSVPYLIAPGALVCFTQLLQRTKKAEKAVYAIELFVLLYAGVYPMSRGGFLCMILPAGILLIEWIVRVIKEKEFGKLYVCIVVCNLIAAVSLLILPDRYKERLLSLESYTFFNSREVLAKTGIELAEGGELFGKGFGYFQKMTNNGYGSHNCFVDIYVAVGIVGVIFFLGIFVYLLVRLRNNLGRAWLGIAFISAMVESQTSYQLWIPIVMAYLLCERKRAEVWKE